LKLALFNADGIPFGLKAEDLVEVVLPYHEGSLKVPVKILEETENFEVHLDDFQSGGLKEGENQTFWAILKRGNKSLTFEFSKSLTVLSKNGKKSITLGAGQ